MTNFTEKFNSITVAFNTNGAQSTSTYTNITGGELWDKLKSPRIGDKNGAHFLRTSLKHGVDGDCLSRGDAHCTEEAWLIIIDVDEATAPPQAVHESLIQADIAHIIIGTHSYYAENINRFRILLLSDTAYSKDKLEPTSEAKDKRNYDEECQLIELEKLAAKDKAKKALKADNRQEAREALQRMDFIDLPVRQRLVVNDATIEKLGELLNENPNGLILVRDELSGWLSKLAKEEYQADRAFYLECFDGNGHYTYDRIGRGTIEIQYCTLSIIGGIQPSKIATLVRDAIRGTSDDGLIQRFQLAIWPDDIGNWTWIDRAPNQQARAKYNVVFEMIHNLHFNKEVRPLWGIFKEVWVT